MNITFLVILLLILLVAYNLKNLLNIKKGKNSTLIWYSNISLALIFIHGFLDSTGLISGAVHFLLLSYPLKFLIVPILLILGGTLGNQKPYSLLRKRYAYPALTIFILMTPFFALEKEEKLSFVMAPEPFQIVLSGVMIVYHLFFLGIFFKNIRVGFYCEGKSFSIGVIAFSLFQALTILSPQRAGFFDMISAIFLFGTLFYFSLHSKKQAGKNSEKLIYDIQEVLNKEKLYLNPKFSLQGLATHLEKTPNEVSRAINSGLSMSFNEMLNAYRVEEVKILLEEDENEKYTLEAIAEMAGFNSLTSFNKHFKSITGKTPKEYKALTKS